MAAGKPTTLYVEVEFTDGVWTDVTSSVNVARDSVTIQRGRASATDTAQPGLLTFRLDNNDGTFTPDNPLSTYYPNIVEGKRVRVRVTAAATTSTRFLGRITEWAPDFPQAGSDSVVTVTAVDALGTLERRVLRPLVTEAHLALGTSGSFFPLTEPSGSSFATADRAYNLIGSPLDTLTPVGSGEVSWGNATGIGTDGASVVTLNPLVYLNGTCDGLQLASIQFFFSASEGATGTVLYWNSKDITAGGVGGYGGLYLNADGYLRITRVEGDGTVIYDGTTAYGPKIADGGVFHIKWAETPGTLGNPSNYRHRLYINDTLIDEAASSGTDTAYLTRVSLGRPLAGTFSFGQLAVNGSTDTYGLGIPSAGTLTQNDLLTHLSTWTGVTIGTTATDRTITAIPTDGMTALDFAQVIANSETGRLWHDYTADAVVIEPAAGAYSSTVALTIDAENDAHGGLYTARNGAPLVKSVTAENGSTSVTVTDDDVDSVATEAVALTSASLTDLEQAATRRLALGKYQKLRPARVALDLATATTSRYVAFFALDLGDRVRVSNLPSTYFGVTYMDGYAEGWVEEIDLAGYRVTFDLSAADAPPSSVFDTGRYGFGDGICTASSLTDSATSVTLTWTGGAALSTSAGDYPLDLDINGERVTVSSAPAGSSSPQTVTIVRGVAPTVARAHSSGDPVEVWDVARYSV